MEKLSTAVRLKTLMEERSLRQVDILEKCKPYCEKYKIKLGRNDLSQYVNGKVEPGQEKLTILGLALNVSEVWLMGYDVPMETKTDNSKKEECPKILQYYEMLNDIGKHEATKRVEELTHLSQYIRENELEVKAAHNDSILDDDEIAKMNRDMELMKKYKK